MFETFAAMLASFAPYAKRCEGALLVFTGVEGFDVFNCSLPFLHKGQWHLYGRVERRGEHGATIRLFVETCRDRFSLVETTVTRQLEDPSIAKIGSEVVMGGTTVIVNARKVANYYCDFYRGSVDEMKYFTSGPDRIRHLRVVPLSDSDVGVFVRCGSGGVALARVKSLHELNESSVLSAVPIEETVVPGATGFVTQAYLLPSGMVGCIARYTAVEEEGAEDCIASFVLNTSTTEVSCFQVIATYSCFPACPARDLHHTGSLYPSGVVPRANGQCDLYSGISGTHQGRITIDYPFEGHGPRVDVLAL